MLLSVAGCAATTEQRARSRVKRGLSWTMSIVMSVMNVRMLAIVMRAKGRRRGTTQGNDAVAGDWIIYLPGWGGDQWRMTDTMMS